MKFLGIGLILVALSYVFGYLREHFLPGCYVFDPTTLKDICNEALAQSSPGANATEIMLNVHAGLKKEYPDYINEFNEDEWVFNNAGNAMGSMLILHASISEYLIFFGSATGSEGHSGNHFADDYFTILTGAEYAALPSGREAEVYLPGDQHHMKWGQSKQYRSSPNMWALELAQGWIPSMLPFGLFDMIFSTLDVKSFIKTATLTAKNMGTNLARGKF
ncbi:C-8 sterol isomerase Erg2p [Trichomonascus vanleenenianus]|uniref:C-8 sterol isomerase ERG2 n=1 Tax=Trichomonascus vanleenenianus TaxID=2268995 RepID=UPI003EC954A1